MTGPHSVFAFTIHAPLAFIVALQALLSQSHELFVPLSVLMVAAELVYGYLTTLRVSHWAES